VGIARLFQAAGAALVIAILAPASARASAPMRIVSLAPSVTETLFALGAGAEVVGVSDYCDYPPAALKLPRVGSFLTPNVEAIVALRPTLVIGLGLSSDQRELRALKSMSIPILMVRDDSLAEIEESIATIGRRIGRTDAAHALLAQIRGQVAAVEARLKRAKNERVMMLVGHQPMVAVGPGTYLDDLLKLARADNIAGSFAEQWPQLSVEYIIAMRPQVILDGQMGNDPAAPSQFWSNYRAIPAVREHRVYGYPQDPILHPGPRIGESLEMLARMIHPEAHNVTSEAHQ
jgi:iron complex transport system substrate-binding protein